MEEDDVLDEDEEDELDDDDDDDEEDEETAIAGEDDDSSTFTSSPSIPDENIDFDLVYTLHTFEATVEGQASVLKGDSLTLLDDSNSYWWLVKVLKTNEVGYIPAENIETPFERLARLNKHRNVEVTAIQQATHYISTIDDTPVATTTTTTTTTGKDIISKQRKHVTMSKDIYYQSHIILLGDDDEELEETYEEWEDDMMDDDSQSTMLASDRDDDPQQISDTEIDHPTTVLRVYAGNINVNATYNSVLVYDHTNAESLLRLAMDRFHISQIEGKSRGKRSSTHSPSQYSPQHSSSGVEYYLSVKPIDGDELTLLPQDKPLMIYQSLNAHLTTPMPSLSNIQQQITNMEFGRIGSPTNNSNKRTGTKYGEDAIRFYLHKRIKRVNDGQLYVKVSLYHDDTKRERRNSDSKDGKRRIDKLIAVSAVATVADLIDIALEKFHLLQQPGQEPTPRYRMTIVVNSQGPGKTKKKKKKLKKKMRIV
ncbi:uncharacterized protein BX664DRAFT_259630 [Halteromyces radiatus]|uniref:uncharacterized protein n=1 Tax=Halteromyces radiatus TaxID=101107 RepID=UPI00221E51FF|nr:uncharacterized protein BX664DRAFT_259630 [Halteromyces radiatus]KAI8093858.1 hypothetical protein BX664DRAFT_259630 [Halteromyces radiatus]